MKQYVATLIGIAIGTLPFFGFGIPQTSIIMTIIPMVGGASIGFFNAWLRYGRVPSGNIRVTVPVTVQMEGDKFVAKALGRASQGKTHDEALANITEALELLYSEEHPGQQPEQ